MVLSIQGELVGLCQAPGSLGNVPGPSGGISSITKATMQLSSAIIATFGWLFTRWTAISKSVSKNSAPLCLHSRQAMSLDIILSLLPCTSVRCTHSFPQQLKVSSHPLHSKLILRSSFRPYITQFEIR